MSYALAKETFIGAHDVREKWLGFGVERCRFRKYSLILLTPFVCRRSIFICWAGVVAFDPDGVWAVGRLAMNQNELLAVEWAGHCSTIGQTLGREFLIDCTQGWIKA